MTKEQVAAQRILEGTASADDIELWLNWPYRMHGSAVLETSARLLLARVRELEDRPARTEEEDEKVRPLT